jgi:hypothetical protein
VADLHGFQTYIPAVLLPMHAAEQKAHVAVPSLIGRWVRPLADRCHEARKEPSERRLYGELGLMNPVSLILSLKRQRYCISQK